MGVLAADQAKPCCTVGQPTFPVFAGHSAAYWDYTAPTLIFMAAYKFCQYPTDIRLSTGHILPHTYFSSRLHDIVDAKPTVVELLAADQAEPCFTVGRLTMPVVIQLTTVYWDYTVLTFIFLNGCVILVTAALKISELLRNYMRIPRASSVHPTYQKQLSI